jgi:hypothetical protein
VSSGEGAEIAGSFAGADRLPKAAFLFTGFDRGWSNMTQEGKIGNMKPDR